MAEALSIDAAGGADAMRIAVVSEIRLYRDGLAQVLSTLGDVATVDTFETATDCLEGTGRVPPDVVLLDMASARSDSSARLLAQRLQGASIVAIAVPEVESRVIACVEAGVTGYVPREGSITDLIATIRMSVQGQATCSPAITAGLMRRLSVLTRSEPTDSQLTTRELEIAGYVARGMTNREIAVSLGIELCTVKNHVHNMLDKLGGSRRVDIAAYISG